MWDKRKGGQVPFITLPSLGRYLKQKSPMCCERRSSLDVLRNEKFLDELCWIIRHKGMGIIRLSGKWGYSAT